MTLVPLSTGAEVAFWICAPLMILAAIGMVFAKKAVYSALLLAAVMIGLAVQYAALDAPFLFVIQIVVYTGAILMLFLFVVMLVGVDARESFVETLKGHRWLAILAGISLLCLILFGITGTLRNTSVGMDALHNHYGGNLRAIAAFIFSRYVYIFEMALALLITAALGAMVLAHRERIRPKQSQADLQRLRIRRYAATGAHPGARPNPGVFARHNGITMPGLLPDGTPAEASLSEALVARGQMVETGDAAQETKAVFGRIADETRGELEK